MDMVYKHISTVTISSTEWVMLGTADISWNLSSIGGVPVQIVQLPVEATPTVDTKCMFTLGGLINNLVSTTGKQLWAKVAEGEGTISYFDNNLDGFEPITELRASVLGLNKEVIKLTTRATKLELDNNSNKHRLTSIERAVASIQGVMGNVIADLVDVRVDHTITKLNLRDELRSTLDRFQIEMLGKLRTYFNEYADDVAALDRTVDVLTIAMNGMLTANSVNTVNMYYTSLLNDYGDNTGLVTLINTIKTTALFILDTKEQPLSNMDYLEGIIGSMQGILAKTIADLADMKVENTVNKLSFDTYLRENFDAYQTQMFTNLRSYLDQYSANILTLDRTVTVLTTAMNTMVNAPNVNVIDMAYASMMVSYAGDEALVTLLDTIKDMSLFILAAKNQELVISNIHHDIALNTADINILKEELGIGEGYWSYTETTGRIALYWESMTRISEATTEEEVATVYGEIIADPEFDPTMTPVITVLRDMMTFIIQSNTVNAAQDEQIEEIADYVDNPVVGAGLDSAGLFNLLGTPEES